MAERREKKNLNIDLQVKKPSAFATNLCFLLIP